MLHKDICDISPINKYDRFSFQRLEATAKDVPDPKLNMFGESGTQGLCVFSQYGSRSESDLECRWSHYLGA